MIDGLNDLLEHESCKVFPSDDNKLIVSSYAMDFNMENVALFEKVLGQAKSLCIFHNEDDDEMTCVFEWKAMNE